MKLQELKDGETRKTRIDVTFRRDGDELCIRLRGELTEEEKMIVCAILMAGGEE